MTTRDETLVERLAPVQGYSAGIPWAMHLRAYDAYCKKYGPQQALIEGGCRGGFGTGELDMFIPGWREELSLIGKLRAEIARLTAQVSDNVAMLDRAARDCVSLTDRALSAERALAKAREALEEIAKGKELCPVTIEYVSTREADIARAALSQDSTP